MKTTLQKSSITESRTSLCVRSISKLTSAVQSDVSITKVFKIPGGHYLQPNGTNFYLTPSAFKYIQP